MDIRLKTIPPHQMISDKVAVGWIDTVKNDKRQGPFFIVTFEGYARNGKMYPGYLALWRFKGNYATFGKAKKAAEEWLNFPLCENPRVVIGRVRRN